MVNIQANPPSPINYDTGWQMLTPNPAAGDKYGAFVSVSYTVGGQITQLQTVGSTLIYMPPP